MEFNEPNKRTPTQKRIFIGFFTLTSIVFLVSCFAYIRSSQMVSLYEHHQKLIYRDVPIKIIGANKSEIDNNIKYHFRVHFKHPKTGKDMILNTTYNCFYNKYSHCNRLMRKYMEINKIFNVYLWDVKPYPIIHFLHMENPYIFNKLDWNYYFKVSRVTFISTVVLVLVYFFMHDINNQNVRMFLMLALCLTIFASSVSIMEAKYHYNANHHDWQYQEVTLEVAYLKKNTETKEQFEVRGRQTTNEQITKYIIHFKDNFEFIKQHDISVPSSTIYCPNEYITNYDECTKHTEKYYGDDSLVHAYFSKVNPSDIILDNVVNTYHLIQSAIIMYLYIVWLVTICVTVTSGFMVYQVKMKRN